MDLKEGNMMSKLGVIPEDWEVLLLGDHLKFKNGLNKASEYFGYGTPIVNYMDVYQNVAIYVVKGRVFLSQNEIKNFSAHRGDVFFTRTSETLHEIGISAVLMNEIENCSFSGFVLRGRPTSNKISTEFFQYCLSPKYVRTQIVSKSSYTTRALTNGRSLSSIRIKCPALPEQIAIATALSDMDALIAQTEKLIAKKKVIKQGVMQRLLSPYEEHGKLKEGWIKKRLGEISDIDSENLSGSTVPDYTFNYISLENIETGKLMGYTQHKFQDAPSRARRIIRKGDILVSTVRPNLKSHFLASQVLKDFICSTGFSVVRCREGIIPEYVFFHFFHGAIAKQIEALISGSNYPSINSNDVRQLLIPLPTIEIQHHIALILTTIDNEIIALESKLGKCLTLKQGMIQNLLTGKIRIYKPRHEFAATI